MSDRIARTFNRSAATRAVALDIPKAFDKVWHAGLLRKLRSYGISGQTFDLISSFLSSMQLRVVLDGKFSQEYPRDTVDWGRKWLVDFNARKTQLVSSDTGLITLVLLM